MTEVADELGIGGRLRAARERLCFTREALAYHSGLSWSAIAQLESGRRTNVRPRTLASLARTLGVTIDYLVLGSMPAPTLEHQALLYEGEQAFMACAEASLRGAVDRSEAALAVTSKARIDGLRECLGDRAERIRFAEQLEWYRTPQAALAAYREFLNEAVGAGAPWVRIVAEPLWNGRTELHTWSRCEALMNLIFSCAPVTVLCTYDTGDLDDAVLDKIRATHPHTIEDDTLAPSDAYSDPAKYVLEG